MPELPDISAYIKALEMRIVGQPLQRVRVASPFLLRTAQPPLADVDGRTVEELRRIGKRIAVKIWQLSISPTAPSCSPKPAASTVHRCIL
jgi:formamidopyrimidine-DNA glycosylase